MGQMAVSKTTILCLVGMDYVAIVVLSLITGVLFRLTKASNDTLKGKEMNDHDHEKMNTLGKNDPDYPVSPDKLPNWFRKGCQSDLIFGDASALSEYLNGCRQDVYSALSLYQVHVRAVITIMLTLLAALTAIFSLAEGVFGLSSAVLVRTAEVVGAGVLIAVFFVACISHCILGRYYEVYVSALLQATQTHYWAKVAGFWWFERVIEDLRKQPDIGKEKYINWRTRSWKDSNRLYLYVVWLMGIAALLGSVYLMIHRPVSG